MCFAVLRSCLLHFSISNISASTMGWRYGFRPRLGVTTANVRDAFYFLVACSVESVYPFIVITVSLGDAHHRSSTHTVIMKRRSFPEASCWKLCVCVTFYLLQGCLQTAASRFFRGSWPGSATTRGRRRVPRGSGMPVRPYRAINATPLSR